MNARSTSTMGSGRLWSEVGGTDSGGRLRGTVLAERPRRPGDPQHIAVPKHVDGAPALQPGALPQHERLLHPRIERPEREQHPLQAGDDAGLRELPDRVSIAVTAGVETEQRALLAPQIDGLSREVQVL